jgi:prepilin-type N-terminal cleavage/methylation domain-containing protein
MQKRKIKRNGFTLFEILIVVTIIGILCSVLIVSMNIQRHLGAGRNVKRKTDTYMISLAIYSYWVDHEQLPTGVTNVAKDICHTNVPDCSGMVDLTDLRKYLGTIPTDPVESNPYSSGYTVRMLNSDQFEVNAPHAENGETIAVIR